MAMKVGVLTGGGDCPGLNPAIRGCVYRGIDHGFEFVGLTDGWKGLVEGNTQPLGLAEVEEIINKGGTMLGTSRTNPFKREGAVEQCLESWKALGLDALVAMGGEDTLGWSALLYGLGPPGTASVEVTAGDAVGRISDPATSAFFIASRQELTPDDIRYPFLDRAGYVLFEGHGLGPAQEP